MRSLNINPVVEPVVPTFHSKGYFSRSQLKKGFIGCELCSLKLELSGTLLTNSYSLQDYT